MLAYGVSQGSCLAPFVLFLNLMILKNTKNSLELACMTIMRYVKDSFTRYFTTLVGGGRVFICYDIILLICKATLQIVRREGKRIP